MRILPTIALALAPTALGCGAATPAASPANATTEETATAGTGAGHGHRHGASGEPGKHHKDLPPALDAFHDRLAPVWHSTPGTERIAKACAEAKDLRAKSDATADVELIDAVTKMEAACGAEGRRDVESALSAVHDRFHVLAKIEKPAAK
jgi:hypothetical protein